MCRGSASASSVVSEADTESLGCSWLLFSLRERRNGSYRAAPQANPPALGRGLGPRAHSLLERCLWQSHGERGVLPELTNGS